MNGRLLRAILDYKDITEDMDYVELVEWFLDVSIHLYNIDANTLENLSSFVEKIDDILLKQDVFQKDDSESWISMDPYFSNKTAHKLTQELWHDDYIFITLWHGWIVLGIDVYLRLQESTPKSWYIYPIRFSRIKHKDKTPKIGNIAELEYISKIIDGKTIIIFDEDSSSGNTLKQAREFFEWNFSIHHRILQVSNLWKWDYETDSFII